jgi:hypothetical protein
MVTPMSIKKIYTDVMSVVDKELGLANDNNPAFNSTHEGYAVIREELDELTEEIESLHRLEKRLWQFIKENVPNACSSVVYGMEDTAIKAACEAIQVAAMCRKFRERGTVL